MTARRSAHCYPEALSVSSFGRRIAILAGDGLEPQIRGLLPPLSHVREFTHHDRTFAIRAPGPCRCGRRHPEGDVYAGRRLVVEGETSRVLESLRLALKNEVAEFARNRVFVHAGAVSWNGEGIVIPGRSMSGKTTLVRAFLDAGGTYFSDEYAVLDARGNLHPYPQALGLRREGVAEQENIPAEALGYLTGTGPVPVRHVLLTTYRSGARYDSQQQTPARVVFGMLEHAVSARRYPVRVLETLERVARIAKGLRMKRGDADAAVRHFLRAIEP